MRNLKKFTALLAVTAMCAGLGMTAFAEESPREEDKPEVTPPTVTVTEDDEKIDSLYGASIFDEDGNLLPVKLGAVDEKVEEILKDEKQVKDILTDAGYAVGKDNQVVVLEAGDVTLIEGELPKGGATLKLFIEKDVKKGDKVYVLHKTENGWEVLEGVVAVDSYGYTYVNVKVTSLSPFAVIKVMSDGKLVALDKKGEPVNVRKAPKTGK